SQSLRRHSLTSDLSPISRPRALEPVRALQRTGEEPPVPFPPLTQLRMVALLEVGEGVVVEISSVRVDRAVERRIDPLPAPAFVGQRLTLRTFVEVHCESRPPPRVLVPRAVEVGHQVLLV